MTHLIWMKSTMELKFFVPLSNQIVSHRDLIQAFICILYYLGATFQQPIVLPNVALLLLVQIRRQ